MAASIRDLDILRMTFTETTRQSRSLYANRGYIAQVSPIYTSMFLLYLAVVLSKSGKGSPLKYMVSLFEPL